MPPFLMRIILMANQNPTIQDVFSFDPSYPYYIKLISGEQFTDMIIETYDNGIVLQGLQHIPTDKIAYFMPILNRQENETDERFVV
jgi:hypothetical protein